MTTGTDLTELLASATIDGPPPPSVSELRRRRRRAQLRRAVVAMAAGCIAIAIGATAVVVAVDDDRSFDVTTVDATTVPTSTSYPASTEPPSPVTAGDGGPAVLMPPDGWRFDAFGTGGFTAPSATLAAVTGPGGVLGPMAWIRFNEGIGLLDYADGPVTHHDTTSPAGHTVRVGSGRTPEDLSAIRAVDGGSVAVTSFDIGESELLMVVDAVTVSDGRISLDSAVLPPGFEVRPTTPDRAYLITGYTLLGTGRAAHVEASRWVGVGSEALLHQRQRTNVRETTINGHPALVAAADPATDNYATAILLDGASWDEPGWAYSFIITPTPSAEPGATDAEIEALLASLALVGSDELVADVPGLLDRQTAIDRWLADAPVPATADLSVLREGPPIGLSGAEWVYQVLTCTLIVDWAITGDDERLDQVAASATWTVDEDMDRYRESLYDEAAANGGGSLPGYDEFITPAELDRTRGAATADERWATPLVDRCRWVTALTGQRRS